MPAGPVWERELGWLPPNVRLPSDIPVSQSSDHRPRADTHRRGAQLRLRLMISWALSKKLLCLGFVFLEI
ncbi:hypothetical protein AAFF_G00237230 [Aldrovandia affinis]|uniref:Uncharacterized protein n=1 Tax=Aldrovandia affinis TaxID=143900 RepID=A0AAD7RH61_9TELE|nr:hypothetical protein AAFF_G00237230 [Aldrovandia affinis]